MKTVLMWAARAAGVLGVAAMLVAFAGRLGGMHWLGPLQVGTVLQASMAAMLLACLAYLAALAEPPR